jgi:hypothetical protein
LKVLEGIDQWLFLDNDTNESVNQFKGLKPISNSALEAWKAQFAFLRNIESSLDRQHVFMVAPAKESVLPEFYPFTRGAQTPIDQLEALADPTTPIFYPASQLADSHHRGMQTYDPGESHWNDRGAYLVVLSLLKRLDLPVPNTLLSDNVSFEARETYGDLDNKIPGRRAGRRVFIRLARENGALTYDNKIHNTGRVWIFNNPQAPRTALLFGDSFSVSLSRLLKEAVGRLVYVHSTSIDASILRQVKPNVLIQEIAERFLVAGPADASSFMLKNAIAGKLKDKSAPEAKAILNKKALDERAGLEPFFAALIS